MSDEHEQHLLHLIKVMNHQMVTKYRRGQAEHGGFLPEKPRRWVLEQLRDEGIDTFVYAQTEIDRLDTEEKIEASTKAPNIDDSLSANES